MINLYGKKYKHNIDSHTLYLVDIDGTIFFHQEELNQMLERTPVLLPGVLEKLNEWKTNGDMVIFTTGRPEDSLAITMAQLHEVGIQYKEHYHAIIMGVPIGKRVVINDAKPWMSITAEGKTIPRNVGISGV